MHSRYPYIGICDFTAAPQSERLVAHLPNDFSHKLMVGVMMSYKTLNGLPTKWSTVFPQRKSIASIFIDDQRVMNTIHYADYAVGANMDRELALTLTKVQALGGQFLDAIQLDMIWPDSDQLRKFHNRFDIPIVLQVGENAMAECKDDPLLVCERLKAYGNSIDYVLFDKSMGKGKGMDATLLSRYVGALLADCPHLLPAVAGGLGPTSMDLVGSLIEAYPSISIDAQSKLRASGDAKDPIDWSMAENYLTQAVSLLSKK